MEKIELGECLMVIELDEDGNGGFVTGGQRVEPVTEMDRLYNAAIDGIESLVLCHAIKGINIRSNSYVQSIKTAIDACEHEYSD